MNEFSRSRDADDPIGHCPNPTENIIIIGSELDLDSFWLKMMFMACGFAVAQGRIPPPGYRHADRTRVLYVPDGYTHLELLPLDFLRDRLGMTVQAVNSPGNLQTILRDRMIDGRRHDILNLVIFAHGLPRYFAFKYPEPNFRLRDSFWTRLPSDLFAENGKLFSYACRTAAPSSGSSLAARIAGHFNITVHAYQRRTFYGGVLRNRSNTVEEETIVAAVQAGSESGGVIPIPPEHEALPHPGLGSGFGGLYGASKEGTKNYALWRLVGARALPNAGVTPAELPSSFETITP